MDAAVNAGPSYQTGVWELGAGAARRFREPKARELPKLFLLRPGFLLAGNGIAI